MIKTNLHWWYRFIPIEFQDKIGDKFLIGKDDIINIYMQINTLLFLMSDNNKVLFENDGGVVTPVMAGTLSQEIKIIIPHNIILWCCLECLIIVKLIYMVLIH